MTQPNQPSQPQQPQPAQQSAAAPQSGQAMQAPAQHQATAQKMGINWGSFDPKMLLDFLSTLLAWAQAHNKPALARALQDAHDEAQQHQSTP